VNLFLRNARILKFIQGFKKGGTIMFDNGSYLAKPLKLSGLHCISDQTMEMHFKLYEGYVKETNRLMEKLWHYPKNGHVDAGEMEVYSELTRRLGFEYNGMVLHEYYFGNLTPIGMGDPHRLSSLSGGGIELWPL
jgi:Fe-Mn family superoxide dismutase